MIDSPMYGAADRALKAKGTDLQSWLRDRADEGLSARAIAELLTEETGGIVQVSREAIRRWIAAMESVA